MIIHSVKYYKDLLESILSEQPDDVPPMPNRADIELRKLKHLIKMKRVPKWLESFKREDGTIFSAEFKLDDPMVSSIYVSFNIYEEYATIYIYVHNMDSDYDIVWKHINGILQRIFDDRQIDDCKYVDVWSWDQIEAMSDRLNTLLTTWFSQPGIAAMLVSNNNAQPPQEP